MAFRDEIRRLRNFFEDEKCEFRWLKENGKFLWFFEIWNILAVEFWWTGELEIF